MISIAMIALFAAVSPAQKIVEDADSQAVCEEALVYEEEPSEEVVFNEEPLEEEQIISDEE